MFGSTLHKFPYRHPFSHRLLFRPVPPGRRRLFVHAEMSRMSFTSRSIVLPLLSLFCSFTPAFADAFAQICEAGNYTANSPYEANLKHLLSSNSTLISVGSRDGFSNGSVGAAASHDRVYGLVLCRGDSDSQDCGSCLRAAAQDTPQQCPSSKSAQSWYDLCFLRYSDANFFSPGWPGNAQLRVLAWNTQNVSEAEQPDVNPQALVGELLRRAPTTRLLYVTAKLQVGRSPTRYGLAQCTRDLNSTACKVCLQALLANANNTSYDLYAQKGWRLLGENCWLRYEAYLFFKDSSAAPPPPPPPPPPTTLGSKPILHQTPSRKGRHLLLWIVVPAAITILVALIGLCLHRFSSNQGPQSRRRARPAMYAYLGASISVDFPKDQANEQDLENCQELPIVNLQTILTATNNFSDANKLGEGGFGPVYKGVLPEGGKEIAIKRLSTKSRQGQKEFMTEVLLIAKLQHKNLVRLLYCCMEKEEMMLIYEYMPNKSLDVFIFDPIKGAEIDCETRIRIISGVARGLLYLHEDSRLTIIHRDLKASNILLDNEMNPKISDFGLARIFGGNQIQANTSRVVGTYGYMSPEYAMEGLFSVKSDVFSFGVVVLEILSGKRNTGFYLSDRASSLTQYAWHLWCVGRPLELVDPLLTKPCHTSKVLKCIHIALLCVQEDAADRPTMSSVVVMLASESLSLPLPKKPAYSVGRNAIELAHSLGGIQFNCSNWMSISEIEAR